MNVALKLTCTLGKQEGGVPGPSGKIRGNKYMCFGRRNVKSDKFVLW